MTSASNSQDLGRLAELVSPYGVVSALSRRRRINGLPIDVAVAAVGGRSMSRFVHHSIAVGIGRSAVSLADACVTAVAEGAERYASADPAGLPMRSGSFTEIGDDALDWSTYPRASAAELADPACRIEPFDPDAQIRWVLGADLRTGAEVWVPAVMAFYALDPGPGERFTHQISTGCAIHFDRDEALLRGLCEVIERDSLAVTWLQMLDLPRLPHDILSSEHRAVVDWCRDHFIDTYLYSGDLGLGVPVAVCLQVAKHDDVCRQQVGAGTGRTQGQAAGRAVGEALGMRTVTWAQDSVPALLEDFTTIEDGARFMAAPARSAAFAFLNQASGPETAAVPVDPMAGDPADALRSVLDTLADQGHRAVWVDCTTPDLAAIGLTCVRVIVASLQPMSLRAPLAFRAHPRVYDAPAAAGFPVLSEKELNPWPHPMC